MVQTLLSHHFRLIAIRVGIESDAYMYFFLFLDECRYAKRQIHASLDDGSVNHATVRDFDLEAERLDQFAAELEAAE